MGKKEGSYSTIIKNTLKNSDGWMDKIPDPTSDYRTVKRAFDLFGVYKDKFLYIESKYQKELKAFNFNRIEEHQIKNLTDLKNHSKKYNLNMGTFISLGVFSPRKYYYIFNFDIDLINHLTFSQKKSILKKQLEILVKNDLKICISKNSFNTDEFVEKIITIEIWKEIFSDNK